MAHGALSGRLGGRPMTRPSRSAANYLTVVLLVWAALLWIIVP